MVDVHCSVFGGELYLALVVSKEALINETPKTRFGNMIHCLVACYQYIEPGQTIGYSYRLMGVRTESTRFSISQYDAVHTTHRPTVAKSQFTWL